MEQPFTVSAKPNTDIWKKAPSTDVFNAPYKPHSSGPLSSFSSTTISFTAPYATKFDQAGLLLLLTSPDQPRRWIKAGIEHFNGQPRASVVCCDRFADWSVADLPPAHFPDTDAVASGSQSVTVRVEREESPNGAALWIYLLVGGDAAASTKIPLREIGWVYNEPEKWELEVSAAVARPGKDVDGELVATFKDFDVQWEGR
jgi:regulation of enolase protein 1 (concanavalin A-like superfamily)